MLHCRRLEEALLPSKVDVAVLDTLPSNDAPGGWTCRGAHFAAVVEGISLLSAPV